MKPTGSIVIINANILTLDPGRATASALAVQDGVIVALGDENEVAPFCAGSSKVDAGGATVTPGMIDTHVHFALTSLGLFAVDASGVPDVSTVLQRIATAAKSLPRDGLVLVNGEVAVEDEKPTGKLAGRAVRHPVKP